MGSRACQPIFCALARETQWVPVRALNAVYICWWHTKPEGPRACSTNSCHDCNVRNPEGSRARCRVAFCSVVTSSTLTDLCIHVNILCVIYTFCFVHPRNLPVATSLVGGIWTSDLYRFLVGLGQVYTRVTALLSGRRVHATSSTQLCLRIHAFVFWRHLHSWSVDPRTFRLGVYIFTHG